MIRRLFMLLAGEGTTGAGGAGGAAGAGANPGGTEQGGQGGAGAAGAAGGAGAAAGGAGAGAQGGQTGAGAGAAGSFAAAAGKGTEGQGEKGAAGAAAAPADLDKLTLPEGVTQIDKPLFEGFKAFAKEKQLQPGQAQELLNFYAKHILDQDKAAVAAAEQRQVQARKALEADPKIGGARFQQSQEIARRAVVALDRQAEGLGTLLVKELDAAGLGDSVAASRLLVFLGEKLGEDKTVTAGGGTGSKSGTAKPSPDERARRRYANSLGAGQEGSK